MTSESYLGLSKDPIRFEAVNQVTNVFFDDSNKQVFAVRSGGVMGVVVKSTKNHENPINFRMEDHGPVISIKFSPDQKVLAVQRSTTSVEFMNFNESLDETEYRQSCKKNSTVVGFIWTQDNEVALMTDHGVELYLVMPEKQSLKHLKSLSVTVQWFVWCSINKIALLASAHGSQLQPVVFKPGTISKLPKVETEPGRMALERDVTLANLYGVLSVLILRHQTGLHTAEVHVHTLNGPGQAPVKSHVLRLGLSGRFAINVVDNLVLIHHQASRCSLVFDTALEIESDGHVSYHSPVALPKSMKPATLDLCGGVEPDYVCELYSPNWVVFQPNIVIDAKLGCLWHIELCLNQMRRHIEDLEICTQFLLNREGGKDVLLDLLMENIQVEKPPLETIRMCFNHINNVYWRWAEVELQNQTASPAGAPIVKKTTTPPPVLIDQMEVYNVILRKLDTDNELAKLEWILIAYLTSLSEFSIQVQHNIDEMLLNTLVRREKFNALQQYIQYGVVSNSKPIACLLLSLGNVYEGATQLALDMLTKLNAVEEIQEVLLSEGQVLSALKLNTHNPNPRKFLDAAYQSGDPVLFHSVVHYFRTNPQFSKALTDERLSEYLTKYDDMFKDD